MDDRANYVKYCQIIGDWLQNLEGIDYDDLINRLDGCEPEQDIEYINWNNGVVLHQGPYQWCSGFVKFAKIGRLIDRIDLSSLKVFIDFDKVYEYVITGSENTIWCDICHNACGSVELIDKCTKSGDSIYACKSCAIPLLCYVNNLIVANASFGTIFCIYDNTCYFINPCSGEVCWLGFGLIEKTIEYKNAVENYSLVKLKEKNKLKKKSNTSLRSNCAFTCLGDKYFSDDIFEFDGRKICYNCRQTAHEYYWGKIRKFWEIKEIMKMHAHTDIAPTIYAYLSA